MNGLVKPALCCVVAATVEEGTDADDEEVDAAILLTPTLEPSPSR